LSEKEFKIDWDKPDPYYETLHTLFYRSIQPETKLKLSDACCKTIDFLRKQLKLKKWETYLVVQTLFEEFPKDELLKEEGCQPKGKPQ